MSSLYSLLSQFQEGLSTKDLLKISSKIEKLSASEKNDLQKNLHFRSPKVAFILHFFFGILGVADFYNENYAPAICKLVLFILCFIFLTPVYAIVSVPIIPTIWSTILVILFFIIGFALVIWWFVGLFLIEKECLEFNKLRMDTLIFQNKNSISTGGFHG